MISDEKAIRLVTKLVRLTHEGLLEWDRVTIPGRHMAPPISNVYRSSHGDLNFQLYQIASRNMRMVLGSRFGSVSDEPQTVLELVDSDGQILVTKSGLPNLKDLFRLVDRPSADVEKLIDSFLAQG